MQLFNSQKTRELSLTGVARFLTRNAFKTWISVHFAHFFKIHLSRGVSEVTFFKLIPYVQDDDDDHDNLHDDNLHDDDDDDDKDHDKNMRNIYLESASHIDNKNEIIHVAKYELQRRKACQERSCKQAGKHERSAPPQR